MEETLPEARSLPTFLIVFILVYGGAHLYALSKARTAFRPGPGVLLAALPILAFLTGAPILVYYLERHGMDFPARLAAWIGYSWMGFLFIFTWIHLAIDALNLLVRIPGALAGRGARPLVVYGREPFLALLCVTLALGAYSLYEASRIRPQHVRIESDRLPPDRPRLRIAQVSDLHLGMLNRHEAVRRIVAIIREEEPDILVGTGDLVDAGIDPADGFAKIFHEIRPPMGKYAVTGNHEFYAGTERSLAFLRNAGFTMLRGEAAVPDNALRVVGVDDVAGARFGDIRGKSERELLAGEPYPRFTLFLKHRPNVSPATAGRFDLQLSGHTHKGQIFPFRMIVRFYFPYLSGLYPLPGGGHLYTSRGTGTWGPPMRFLAPPEVTIIDVVRRGA